MKRGITALFAILGLNTFANVSKANPKEATISEKESKNRELFDRLINEGKITTSKIKKDSECGGMGGGEGMGK